VLRLPVGPGERWAANLSLGAALCSLWVLALGLVGLLGPVPLAAGILAQAALGRWRRPRSLPMPILVATAAGITHLVIALGPPHFYDAMVYHLGLPWQALQEGGWSAHPENVFSAFPPVAQLVATPPLAWEALRAPGLLHWFAWVCAATAAGSLARRLGAGSGASLLLTAAAMLLPTAPLLPGFPAAEGWFLAALVPALCLTLPGSSRSGAVPGAMLLAGVAASTRVQGLPWALLILTVAVWRRSRPSTLVRGLALFVVGASPWWLKNLVLLGDPIAPLLWSREGLDTLWRDGASLLRSGMTPLDVVTKLPLILAPIALTVAPLLALAALAAARVRSSRPALLVALAGLLAWAATGALPRFVTPVLLLLAAVVLSWRRSLVSTVAGALLVAVTLGHGLITQMRWLDYVHPVVIVPRSFVDAAPLVSPNPPFAAFAEADRALPDDAVVLVVGDSRPFGLPRRVIVTSQHDPDLLRPLIEGSATTEAVVRDLLAQGVTHLAVNDGELERLAAGYPIEPWRTTRGKSRWIALRRALEPPVVDRQTVRIYELERALSDRDADLAEVTP
jgi:hypothetical protein